MSRLSYQNFADRNRARRASYQNFAARNRARRAESRARRDQAAEFRRAAALQAQEAKNRQQELILQANLQAQAAAGQMYAQQQYAKQAGRSKMADDTTLRQRNRLDGIFDRKQQMAAAWEQSKIQQQLADQQAALQAQRDAQLHGYGQADARLQHGFNQDMSRMTHGQQMRRDATQQGYAQDNARLGAQFQADQMRQQHGYGQDDMRLQQQFAQDNWIDKVIEERSRAGYTLNPSQQRMADEIEEKKGNALKMYMSGQLTQQDYAQQLQQLAQAKRHLIPDVPPEAQQLPTMDEYWQQHVKQDEFGNIIYRDPSTGKVTFDRARPTGGGGSSEKSGRYDPDTGRLNPAETSALFADMRKSYAEYAREAMKPNEDGTPSSRKIKSWDEFVREEVLKYPPDERAVFEEFMGGPKQLSIDKIKNNREMTAAEHQMMDALGLSGGPRNYSQVKQLPPPEIVDPIEQSMTQNRLESQETAALVDSYDNDPVVKAALVRNPEMARPILNEIRDVLKEYNSIQASGISPLQKKPELLESINRMLQTLENLPATNIDYGQGYSY